MHRTCPLVGVKRTCRIALQMSAYDPKRTSVSWQTRELGPGPKQFELLISRGASRGWLIDAWASIVTPFLTPFLPIFTPILPIVTPIFASILPIFTPIFAPLHSGRLSLRIRHGQHHSWNCET